MSGGGDIRVLRQEAGQESSRMPAWKREILERRKAKGGACGGAGAAEANNSGGAAPGNVNGAASGGGSRRNYTITAASQHFANNKEPTEGTAPSDGRESLVLQDSLGPLQENPFIKLEKERRRQQDRENTARPVQHILELYGSVPGIRTIRAENIIIIESDPDYFPDAGAVKTESKWQQNGLSGYSSLNDLLDRRGSAVTEIRAKEVVIYDTTLSKSEENLSTLGRTDPEDPSYNSGEGQGRVSRMLQKFDSNYGKLHKKSHSTENLLDLDCSASSRPRVWSKTQPDLVPKPTPYTGPGPSGSGQPSSPVFQSPSKPKLHSAFSEPGSPRRLAGTPQSVSSFRQRFEESGGHMDEPDMGSIKTTRERDWEGAEVPPKPKVPCSPETRRARAETPLSPISCKVFHSSPDFEIRPSPMPDLSLIPEGDTQARALANLRLQSQNSFMVIPKRRLVASSELTSPAPPVPVNFSPTHRTTEMTKPGVPTSHNPLLTPTPSNRIEETEVDRAIRGFKPDPSSVVTTTSSQPPSLAPSSSPPAFPPAPSSPLATSSPPPTPVLSDSPILSPAPEQPAEDHLPITNIDDIEVEPPRRIPLPSPVVQRKKGNTFTVVPKRKVEPEAQPGSPEPQLDPSGEASPCSTPSQAPYTQLGSLLKKRYPAVEEIEVIGGYLSLAKSCLSKTGSMGKKLKISFNELRLHSTYEYPSESSVWDSGEEDEDDKRDETEADEQPSMVGRIHIPRPSFTSSPTHTANGNDLSSYIPKHSMDFNTWQEHKHDESVHEGNTSMQPKQISEEVMLTPADSNSLSDFSSEPALYF
ncbi:taperin [Thalassophryne amazonica]|uniref:taperin n=1 Tax=Thalassophryne amazonica TaxID=390379 RepID=UPI001470CAEA|nr:taperin [Thalassophryne amazonica]